MILGAGYAGVTLAQRVWQRTKGRWTILLVDQSPFHVLRTELYEIGEMASFLGASHWSLPLEEVFDHTNVRFQQGKVLSIDLVHRRVELDTVGIKFGTLAICLGNQPAFYGVEGAREHAHQVYGLEGARRLAGAIRESELASVHLPGERHPRFVVIGGGATGAELAGDLATTDWPSATSPGARSPEIVLITGALPFLTGLPPSVQRHAREQLQAAGVRLLEGVNATRVEPKRVHLEDGSRLTADLVVWAAGVEAPTIVRALPVAHGRGGRIAVRPTLEVPGFPGVFAVGDVAEIVDPYTQMPIPQTAQAAIAEAREAADNLVALRANAGLRPFIYHEKASILAMGPQRGAATLRGVTLWGRPVSWLKRSVEREYVHSLRRGKTSRLLSVEGSVTHHSAQHRQELTCSLLIWSPEGGVWGGEFVAPS